MKITEQQVEAAYSIAKKVYSGELKTQDGSLFLTEEHGLNRTSATDFINDYRYMLNGRLFQRGMSASAMKYFIESIYKDGNSNSLRKALNALNLHIEYWENHYNVTAHSMRRVSEQFEKVCNLPKTESDYIRQFDAEVKNALSLSSSERKKLIKESAKEPTKVEVTTHIFSRNPHVVAERLLIANGKCEHCKKDAPFIRIKDGTPYLEVHHKEKLADGGEDTLENTIALCPNCHRKFHFGNPSA